VAALVCVHRYLPGFITDRHQLHPFADAVRQLANAKIPDTYGSAAVLRFSVLGTAIFEPSS